MGLGSLTETGFENIRFLCFGSVPQLAKYMIAISPEAGSLLFDGAYWWCFGLSPDIVLRLFQVPHQYVD